MAQLRERKPPPNLTPTQRKALHNISAAPGFQRTPRRPRQTNRSLHISISLLILGFFVFYAQQHRPDRVTYKPGLVLPNWYAICSKEGRRVYTIPEEGGEGAVECIVVNGKRVADTGSLGMWYLHSSL